MKLQEIIGVALVFEVMFSCQAIGDKKLILNQRFLRGKDRNSPAEVLPSPFVSSVEMKSRVLVPEEKDEDLDLEVIEAQVENDINLEEELLEEVKEVEELKLVSEGIELVELENEEEEIKQEISAVRADESMLEVVAEEIMNGSPSQVDVPLNSQEQEDDYSPESDGDVQVAEELADIVETAENDIEQIEEQLNEDADLVDQLENEKQKIKLQKAGSKSAKEIAQLENSIAVLDEEINEIEEEETELIIEDVEEKISEDEEIKKELFKEDEALKNIAKLNKNDMKTIAAIKEKEKEVEEEIAAIEEEEEELEEEVYDAAIEQTVEDDTKTDTEADYSGNTIEKDKKKTIVTDEGEGSFFALEMFLENIFFYVLFIAGCCISGYAVIQLRKGNFRFDNPNNNSASSHGKYERVPQDQGKSLITPDLIRIN